MNQTQFTLLTPQFSNITSQDVRLQDIIPQTTGQSSGVIILQTLLPSGATDKMYYWYDRTIPVVKKGWYLDGITFEDVTFKAGTGFWIQNDAGESINVQTSGKVLVEDVKVKLGSQFVAAGNPFPASINLQDIYVEMESDPNGNAKSGGIILQTLKNTGETDQMYAWYDRTVPVKKRGWFRDGESTPADVSFDAGQGFWIQGSSDEGEQYVCFPSPIESTSVE